MKSGIAVLIGRPNSGKSTLLNNLLRRKVAITSPKPQTTRFPLQAVYEDEQGQIIFVDTPGLFAKTPDPLSRTINAQAQAALEQNMDVALYVIDRTRARDLEENIALGMVRKLMVPKILVINKTDLPQRYASEYAFYEDEFPNRVEISAIHRWNFNILLDKIYETFPERENLVDTSKLIQPGLNLDSKLFLSEIIREKVFLFTRDEVPYTITTKVDKIEERPGNLLYIRGSIITNNDRYKKILIGRSGFLIKKIGMAVRKEIEQAAGKQVFIDLTVEVDPHWMESF